LVCWRRPRRRWWLGGEWVYKRRGWIQEKVSHNFLQLSLGVKHSGLLIEQTIFITTTISKCTPLGDTNMDAC